MFKKKNGDGPLMLYIFSFLYLQKSKKLAPDQRTRRTNTELASHIHLMQTMQFNMTVKTFNQVNLVHICCVLLISYLIYA